MKIIAIALNTFREAVRDKVLYSLIAFALALIGFGSILDRITIGQSDKLIKDFGLSSISIIGVMISIFVGINLVFKEIEKKTVYTVLAKPIQRWQFLVGKTAGLWITLAVEVVIMSIGLVLVLSMFGEHGVHGSLFKAIWLIYVELALMTAIAIFFSSFSTPFLSGIFTLSFFVIGHLTEELKRFSERFSEAGQTLSTIIYYVAPNLEWLNVRVPVVHGKLVTWQEIIWRTSYGGMYTLFLLTCAVLIFQKREFK